jgi:two-component system sensor histidine kinase KdpD
MKIMINKNESGTKNFYRAIIMTAIFLIASGIGYLFRYINFPDTNIVVVYLLAVHMTAWLARSFVFGFIASLLATFSFNYFFAEPIFTFSVNDPNYIVTFITMTVTALITSTLTSHVQRSATEAKEKEAETKAIYNLTNHLTDAKEIHDIASIAASTISECFSCNAACLCFDEENMPENTFVQQMLGGEQVRREVADVDEMKHRIESLRTGFDIGAEFADWPIYGRENILGVVRIPNEKEKSMNEAQKRLLRSMIESAALAMDRFRSAEQRIKSRDEIEKERYRANLLRAISHDIRTPLSGMIGTTEMLLGMTEIDDPRYDLLKGIQKSADWLHSLVENILNLTRLQDGKLSVNKQQEAVEEVIGGAVSHIAARAPEYEISVNVPDELLLVPMDAKLIEQVLINLLDNAVKHTAPKREIGVVVELCENEDMVKFTVKDRGTGIREKDLPNIFMMFYTSHVKHADAKKGMGLGLAICETIIKAHGGSIEAHNRKDGQGAEFIFKLPTEVGSDEQA